MVGLAIRFDLGRYHGNAWSAHVNEGVTEWPPSPWRVIRALYSVARTNLSLASRLHAIDSALARLIESGPPVYELPRSEVAHSRHYVPLRNHSAQRTATSKIIDAFRAISPDEELRVWWHAELRSDEADALGEAAHTVGYLGRSESACSARLIAGAGAGPESPSAWPATDVGEHEVVQLLCPTPGVELREIGISVTDIRRQRQNMPPGAELTTFAVSEPNHATPPAVTGVQERPTLVLLRVRGSARAGFVDAVSVAQALRSAAMGRYGEANGKTSSPTLSGRAGSDRRTDQHRHAHYLVLPDRSGRRVDRLVVWSPEGLAPADVSALAAIRRLTVRGLSESMHIAVSALGDEETMNLPTVLGPARSWRSLTPFALPRYPKQRRGHLVDGPEDQVRRELALRSLPEPNGIALERGSWHRFKTQKTGQSRLERASVFGVRLEFSEELSGPLSLGALCHFGLGLFVPDA